MDQNLEIDEGDRAMWRTELYKAELCLFKCCPGLKLRLFKRWFMFLDLHAKLPDPGEIAALREIRLLRPGKDVTLDEIKEACREVSFRTPDTDIPGRLLCPAEVSLINVCYLQYCSIRARRLEQKLWMLNDLPTAEVGRNLETE